MGHTKDRPLKAANHVVVDWDGTAVRQSYPERTREFMPGFVEAMWRFHRAGLVPVIESARFNKHNAYTHRKTQADIARAAAERAYVRDTLDQAGLTFVQIHDQEGKPSGMVYIDDKGERYLGKRDSWRRMVDKVLIRAGRYDEEDE